MVVLPFMIFSMLASTAGGGRVSTSVSTSEGLEGGRESIKQRSGIRGEKVEVGR